MLETPTFVTRFARLGLALALMAGTMAPIAHAQRAASTKTLVMGVSQEPDTFVGGEGGLYVTAVASNLIYGQPGLVGIDDQMRPEAELATDIPTLDNGEAVMVGDGADEHLETTFHLRQNATFSDGSPVTASDVVFSWKLSLNAAWPAQAGNDLESKYSDVVALDPHTVIFKMMSQNQARDAGNTSQQGPVINPFYLYGLPDVYIYPSKRLGSLVDFDPQNSPKVANLQSSVYGRHPVGAGPYVLDSWDPGLEMLFHARPDYYRGKPAIDTIVIRGFSTSKETLLAQLQAGDLQTLGPETLDVSDVDTVSSIPGVTAYVRAGTGIEHIDMATLAAATAPPGVNSYGTPFPTDPPTRSFAERAQQFFGSRFLDAGIDDVSHKCAPDSAFANSDFCKKAGVTRSGWVSVNYLAGADDCATVNWVTGDFEVFAPIALKQIPDLGAFQLTAWISFQQSARETDYHAIGGVPGASLSATGAMRVITRGVDIEPGLRFSISRSAANAVNWNNISAQDLGNTFQPAACPCPDADTWVNFNYQIAGPWGTFKKGNCS